MTMDHNLKYITHMSRNYRAADFGVSDRKGKRFYVVNSEGKKIHFGSNSRTTFYDMSFSDEYIPSYYRNRQKRNYRKRHENI